MLVVNMADYVFWFEIPELIFTVKADWLDKDSISV
jgi:hypothetical protein